MELPGSYTVPGGSGKYHAQEAGSPPVKGGRKKKGGRQRK